MKIFCVRIGNKYGPEYEDYINSKLDNVTWIREPFDPRVHLQWNKLYPMSLDIDEPVVVLDIDIVLRGDYMDMINYPIERGQFVGIHTWWHDCIDHSQFLQGGFQKYYPKDCRYIFDKFMADPGGWQVHYTMNGKTEGHLNGEQNFVQDSVLERLEFVSVPKEWVTPWRSNPSKEWVYQMTEIYPGEYLWLGEFNPQIRFVHYQSYCEDYIEGQKAQQHRSTYEAEI